MGDRQPIHHAESVQDHRSRRRVAGFVANHPLASRLALLMTLAAGPACGNAVSNESGRDVRTSFSSVTTIGRATIDTQLPGTTTTTVAGAQPESASGESVQDAVSDASDQADIQDKAKVKAQKHGTTVPKQAPTTVFDGPTAASEPAGVLPEETPAQPEFQPQPEPGEDPDEPEPRDPFGEPAPGSILQPYLIMPCGRDGQSVCFDSREDAFGRPAVEFCLPPAMRFGDFCRVKQAAPALPQPEAVLPPSDPDPLTPPTTRPRGGDAGHQ